MNHKIKIIMISICASLVLCLLSLGFSLRSICVNTLSDVNINPNIANRIDDIVFDNFTGLTNQQLLNIQEDIKNSKALYKINGYYFDQAVNYILNDKKIETNQENMDAFIDEVISIIESHINQELSQESRQAMISQIQEKINFKNIYISVVDGLKSSLSVKGKLMIRIYQMMTSLIFKMILVVILIGVLYELSKFSEHRLFFMIVAGIFIMASLMDYLIVLVINQLSSFLSIRLIGQSMTIQLDRLFIAAIIYLSLGLIQVCYAYYRCRKD